MVGVAVTWSLRASHVIVHQGVCQVERLLTVYAILATESMAIGGLGGSRNPLSPTTGRLHKEGMCLCMSTCYLVCLLH